MAGGAQSCATLVSMKFAPLVTLLCVLPLAGCYVVPYPGGALTLSPTPFAPQAMRAAPGTPGAADVATTPVPTPRVSAAAVRSSPVPPPPAGTARRETYPNGSPVPPDYRPPSQPAPRAPAYPNGSPVPPDYVPPPTVHMPSGAVVYSPDAAYVAYPTYSTYSAYPAYPAYPAYVAYPAYSAYSGYSGYSAYPTFAPSPWVNPVSFSFSWGRGRGGWGSRCCHRWR